MSPRPSRLPAVVVVLALVLHASAQAQAQDLSGATRELSDIETAAMQLGALPLRGSQLRSATYVEERLTDGELFYRLQDYVRASIIFTDIVDNYPKHAAYPDALFLLAESLFQAGDLLGSRTRYRMILDHADETVYRPHVQRALGRLIEIAIHVRDFDGIDRYFERLSQLPPTEVESATAYFRAKYLYNVAVPADAMREPSAPLPQIDPAKLENARLAFEAVDSRSPYYAQARYFVGVIYALRGQYNPALEAFSKVAQLKVTTEQQREVVELAQLALGRLYYETNELSKAIDAYQTVARASRQFDTALYEIAWAYIRLGDSTKAERALEVLSIASPDSRYIPDAKLLRGNLLLRDGRFDAANDVFGQVTKEFQPVREQLDQIVAEHGDPQTYFRSLVHNNLEEFDAQAFLPPLALRWANIEGDMERALAAVADLSQARHMVHETGDIVERLRGALDAPNRVNIFPDLRDHRERTIALRNRAARVRQQLIADDDAQTKQYNSAELTAVRARRREIERTLSGLPTKDSDFQARNGQVDSGFDALTKQLSELDVELLGLDARMTATTRFMADTMQKPEQKAGVDAYNAELATQRQALGGYHEQLDKLKLEVESGRIQVGVGDGNYLRDDQLRDEHKQVVAKERQLTAGLGAQTNANLDAMFQRLDAVELTLDAHDKLVDQVVAERAQDMQKVLDEEGGKLGGYQQQLAQLDTQTEDVVGGIAYGNYQQVQKRFYDLVLKADVGLVDVGWAQKEEHSTRVDLLTRERTRALQALDDELNEIMDGRGKP
jgi:TolA-binding protein